MFQSTVANRPPLATIHQALTAHHQQGVEPTGHHTHTHHLNQDTILKGSTHPIHNQVVSQDIQDQPLTLCRPQCPLLVDTSSNHHQPLIQLEDIINHLTPHSRVTLGEGIPPALVGTSLLILRYGCGILICEGVIGL